MDRREIGKDAEVQAERFLHQQGLRTLARNARCRLGEIDLVMQDGDTLVFVEVRKRRHRGYGGAAQSVDQNKQRKLTLTARYLLARHPHWSLLPCRFDVIAYEADSARQGPLWYKDAFRL